MITITIATIITITITITKVWLPHLRQEHMANKTREPSKATVIVVVVLVVLK